MRKISILGFVLFLSLVSGGRAVFADISVPYGESIIGTERDFVMSEESFARWLEERIALNAEIGNFSEEELQLQRVEFEETLEHIKNGATVIMYDAGERGYSWATHEGGYEIATIESFRVWMEQQFLEDKQSGRFTPHELNWSREVYEDVLDNIKNGAIVLLLEEGWYYEFGSTEIHPIEVTYRKVNYDEFKAWTEEILFKLKAGGEYSNGEIEVLRKKYDEVLKQFKDDENIHFMVDDDGNFYMVDSAYTEE